jgi:predicted dehydrogenase
MSRPGFAVIGAGLFGRLHARVYSGDPRLRLAAVCDLDAARARQVAEESSAARWGTDFREVIADPEIVAVSIATPDFAHTEIALAAAHAGKHLLVEKPLAMSLPEAEAIVSAARQSGVKLMVDFHNRWNPALFRLHEDLRAGKLGDPVHLYLRLSNTTHVPTRMLSWAARSSPLWFLGSHCVDLACWLLGRAPARISAWTGKGVLASLGVEAADYYLSVLEFGAGAVALIENSWILPESSANVFDSKLELIGSRGAAYFDGSHHRALERIDREGASLPDLLVMPEVMGKQLGFAAESIRHFSDCVLEDRAPAVTGEDGLRATRILCAIEEAAQSGRRIEVSGQ